MIYKTHGVCSQEINFEVQDNKLTNVRFVGGCSGLSLIHIFSPQGSVYARLLLPRRPRLRTLAGIAPALPH